MELLLPLILCSLYRHCLRLKSSGYALFSRFSIILIHPVDIDSPPTLNFSNGCCSHFTSLPSPLHPQPVQVLKEMPCCRAGCGLRLPVSCQFGDCSHFALHAAALLKVAFAKPDSCFLRQSVRVYFAYSCHDLFTSSLVLLSASLVPYPSSASGTSGTVSAFSIVAESTDTRTACTAAAPSLEPCLYDDHQNYINVSVRIRSIIATIWEVRAGWRGVVSKQPARRYYYVLNGD